MANPILTQIELPSGSVYDIHDSRVDSLNNWEYAVCTNAADTPQGVTWQSGSTTITGTLVASADTMYKIYLVPDTNGTNDTFDEYITVNPSGSTYQWELFGNTKLPDMTQYVKNKTGHSGGTAGELAYKDSASGSVTVPKTYTSSTTVSTATTESKSVSVTGTTTGSVSPTKSTVDIKPNSTGTAANKYTPAGTNSTSSVSGTCSVTPSGSISVGTGTANYTPAGSNASSSVSGTCSVTPTGSISTGTGTANYTPAGSVSTPTVSLDANGTTTIKNPSSKTVVTDMSVAAPSATAATGELVYCEVSGTKLTLKKFVETTGASISTSNVSVVKGAATWTASQPSFTGTGAELKFTGSSSSGTISGTAAAQTFTGTGANLKFTGSSSSGTISGTAAAQTFTGTDTYLKTASQVMTDASFTGASMTSTGSVAVPATYSATTTTTTNTTESKTVTVT